MCGDGGPVGRRSAEPGCHVLWQWLAAPCARCVCAQRSAAQRLSRGCDPSADGESDSGGALRVFTLIRPDAQSDGTFKEVTDALPLVNDDGASVTEAEAMAAIEAA